MDIIWLPQAVNNLAAIHAFIAKERPASAEKVAQKIKQTVAMLEAHPQLGKTSLVDGFREIQVANLPFVIPYKVVCNKLIVARVFHNRKSPMQWDL